MEYGDTVVQHRSYGNKLCEACGCSVVGLLIFAASGPLVWYNEGRAVYTARAIAAGARSAVEAPCAPIDPSFEGRLVHMTCKLEGLQTFRPLGGALVVNDSAFLETDAEMFQWVEHSTTSSKKDSVGGGTTTTTRYTYTRDWSSHPIDSSGFKKPLGASGERRANPAASSWPVKSGVERATALRAGAHALGAKLSAQIRGAAAVQMAPRDGGGVPPARQPPPKLDATTTTVPGDGWAYTTDAHSPQVGGMRVRFKRSTATTVSVLAAQKADGFGVWEGDPAAPSSGPSSLWPSGAGGGNTVAHGYGLLSLEEGEASAHEMLAGLSSANAALTWALRACGLAASWAGLMMVGRPLTVMPDAIPCVGPAIGEMASCALGCAALGVAIVYTCLVGAVAWLRFRPLLAAALFAVAAAAACALGGARMRCGPTSSSPANRPWSVRPGWPQSAAPPFGGGGWDEGGGGAGGYYPSACGPTAPCGAQHPLPTAPPPPPGYLASERDALLQRSGVPLPPHAGQCYGYGQPAPAMPAGAVPASAWPAGAV
mmetsp:Transcript_23814/g.61333  ORF Transcript_23814/g.61333 Transcript_23814/m.61333 type:complete len:541 (+) Transcript_23814:194-1816(+)